MNDTYNPDVLSCLANLSNDEVFTPPAVVNQMLDLLPPELFRDSTTTFLDIGCKSGVFLREIAKRLIAGLAEEIPDLQTRVDHILHRQVFGIATTELTSLVARRTLYCSKYPNCRYSASRFETVEGNIRFRNIPHEFVNGRCKWCGASEDQFGAAKRKGLETHAYEFIHTAHPEEIFNMKFDVIVGNPPYQLADGGNGVSAAPIYNKFVEQAKKLNPRYLTMIIPARWYTGGKGLDDFRDAMLSDKHIKYIRDYVNAKDCFGELSISGGVCYFLWDKNYKGLCDFSSVIAGKESLAKRDLDEYPIFVRYNEAVKIIHKVLNPDFVSLKDSLSSRNPFGIPTKARGSEEKFQNSYRLYSSQGIGYVDVHDVLTNNDIADSWKVMITRVMREHAGEPDKSGLFGVLATVKVLKPGDVCTDSYVVAGNFENKDEAENLARYLCSKFVRFLVLQAAASINLSKSTYQFVPMQDFSKPWTDAELYAKYKLTKDEIAFIESMIKPME